MRFAVIAGAATALPPPPAAPTRAARVQGRPAVAGDLVITEVFADYEAPPGGTGTDAGKEWFEIYNASDRPLVAQGPDDHRTAAPTARRRSST